ncbi:MAG: DNA starvation/stationary phase protection protein [Pseudomonadota bacterium]
MASSLDVVAHEETVSTGVQNSKGIVDGLADVLADTYRLTFKTHTYHWNVAGPLFYSVHNMTEEQYENMFDAADELAERIRALGHLAPISFQDLSTKSVLKDFDTTPSAGEMVADLAADHERVAHRLHALIELAGARKDEVTVDLATERSAFHEKAAWMLRALIAE